MKRYIRASEDWRLQDPKYQEKTLGGVYFYAFPGPFGERISRGYYEYLPKYAQKAVLQLDGTGVSISGWFKTVDGIVYMNHLNSDFLWAVRHYGKEKYENANGWDDGDPDKFVTDTFCS